MKIIALTGWSESGKDTVADILVKSHGFKKYAIATPLKDLCSSLYGFPRELAETQEGKKTQLRVGYKIKTVRELLLETAIIDRARFGDCVYIDKILDEISNDKNSLVVITDLRYYTELTAIKKYVDLHRDSFEVWKVVRDGQLESPVNDPSEYSITTVQPHYTIHNDGKSFDDLSQKVSEGISRTDTKNELSNTKDEEDSCCVM